MRFLRLLGLVLLALPAGAFAQLIFTITGTAQSSALGYTVNDPITVVFTVNPTFSANSSSSFNSATNSWVEELTSEAQLYTAVTGTGLLGSFQRPTLDADAPYSTLIVDSAHNLELRASSDSGNIGLSSPSHASVYKIRAILSGVSAFSLISGYAQPIDYFATHQGTFTSLGGALEIYQELYPYDSAVFTPTSLTISVTAVPESAAHAIFAGLFALSAFIVVRRRRLWSASPASGR